MGRKKNKGDNFHFKWQKFDMSEVWAKIEPVIKKVLRNTYLFSCQSISSKSFFLDFNCETSINVLSQDTPPLRTLILSSHSPAIHTQPPEANIPQLQPLPINISVQSIQWDRPCDSTRPHSTLRRLGWASQVTIIFYISHNHITVELPPAIIHQSILYMTARCVPAVSERRLKGVFNGDR